MDSLFQPIKINKLEIKNRIYLPAMHLGMAVDFQVTDQLIDFYAERAKGGAGIIVVGNATVDDVSGFFSYIGAHSDEFIPGLTKLAEVIKANGARAAVQLNHAGRYAHSMLMEGRKPVAPSPIAPSLSDEVPDELDIEGIQNIISSFAKAAERVKKSGYDAVEILSGTGYLISEFLSPVTNKRNDKYGGCFENRIRFGVEIMQAIRKAVGADFPVIVRLDNNDFMEGGQRSDELGQYAKILVEECGVDALCIKGSWHEARVPQLTPNVPRGAYAYLARNIKKIVGVPVIASHRINDPSVAREILDDGFCDMVAMGRSLIADPYLPIKAKEGAESEIVHCIACAQGCFDNLFKLKPVECLCNPKAGYEGSKAIVKSGSPKKVMVIGGGVAGMSAALAAKERGHEVTIYEKKDILGGQIFLAATPPGREEFYELAKDYATQVASANIRIKFNTIVDESLLDSEKPDAVILATGAVPLTPPVPGVELEHVVQAWDVLMGRVTTGENIVVVGGGAVGVETAMFLAEKGTLSGDAIKFLLVNKAESLETLYDLATKGSKEVVLLEMADKIGAGIGRSTKWVMYQEIDKTRITTRTGTKALEIKKDSVIVESGAGVEEIPADTVVLAAGAVPVNDLLKMIEKKGIEVKIAGDAGGIALAFDAVHQGFDAGRSI